MNAPPFLSCRSRSGLRPRERADANALSEPKVAAAFAAAATVAVTVAAAVGGFVAVQFTDDMNRLQREVECSCESISEMRER